MTPQAAVRAAPKGKDAVRRALLDAAAELFAAEGPARVGVREIADRARVNHGLVHRHFGSKRGLLRAVLDDLSARIWQVSQSGGADGPKDVRTVFQSAERAVADNPLYFRVLARALLDGEAPSDMQSAYPLVKRLVETLAGAQARGKIAADLRPDMLVALLVAGGLGWLVFEPYLLAATGQADLPAGVVRQRLEETLGRLALRGAAAVA